MRQTSIAVLLAFLGLVAPASEPPAIDESDALRRLGASSSAAWIEDGTLFAVVRVEADAVQLLSAVQKPLERLTSPDLWGGAFPLERADEAVMSCGFGIKLRDTFERKHDTPPIRGPRARKAPTVIDPPRGTVTMYEFDSKALGATRTIHVYMPPSIAPKAIEQIVFLADGQSAARYAIVVEPLVVSGAIPPTAIVGIASDTRGGNADPSTDIRAMEYLRGFSEFAEGADPGRFDRHWRFFTEEVPAWVETELGIVVPREGRIVAGASNGGAFAATVAALAPDRFGASIVLSSGWMLVAELFAPLPEEAAGHRAFFSAGLYEARFLEQTRSAHDAAAKAGYITTFDERVGGHDPLIWCEQLAAGLQWIRSSRHESGSGS